MHPHFATPWAGARNGLDIRSNPDERRRFVTSRARRTREIVGNVARPLAAEREYLRLERTDHDRRITEAVAKQAAAVSTFDQRIAPPDPTCSPVRVGVLERLPDHCDGQRSKYVYLPVGGPTNAITVGLPIGGIDGEVERIVCDLVAAVVSNLEPIPIDD